MARSPGINPMVMDTITSTAERIRRGEQSATEMVQASLERIDTHDKSLSAFLSVSSERALNRARLVDQARSAGKTLGPLAGVPLSVKDNLCTDFDHTTCGSTMLRSFESRYSAHAIRRLEDAGAVIVGKTNLDEFAMGSSTENSARGPTRNPWDTGRVPGGSSGGAATAVAAGMVCAALGSDTGGSIRQPASFCGVTGLKPSYGRVSRYGLVAFASSLDQIGPITRDVRDAALLLGLIAGHDPRDATSVDRPVPDYLSALDRPINDVRIGYCESHFQEGVAEDVRSVLQAALEVFQQEGATLVPVDLPHERYGLPCYYLLASAEAASNLARFDGVHYGRRSPDADGVFDMYADSRGQGFGPEVKRRIMLGTFALSSGYYDAYYLKASRVRRLISQDFDGVFERVDVLASPTTPTTAFKLGDKTQDPLAMYLSDVFTLSANLAGLCAISLPAGHDKAGLPVGLELMAAPFEEANLLTVAHQYQQRTDHHTRRPPGHGKD